MRRSILPLVLALGMGMLLCACGGQNTPASAPVSSSALPVAAQPEPVQEPEPEPEPEPPEAAQLLLDAMTQEEKVGQLFFVRFPGSNAPQLAREWHLGGYILFGQDFKSRTPEQVRQLLTECQNAVQTPLLLGVDEEGGTVVRASAYPAFRAQRFPSPQSLYAAGGLEAVHADAFEKSAFLLDLGLNVNLAPVCDVSTNPNDFIYPRSLGQDAQTTAQYIAQVVAAMNESGIGSVLKHFPGYGNNADTHTGIALDQRPLSQFREQDLLPFQSGVQAGAGAVLVSHNIVTCLDETLPASLSPAAYALLREEVGFDGVAMTDDLDMGAVQSCVKDGSAAVAALAAGADMVLTSAPQEQIPLVLAALEDGVLSPERLDEAVLRVLRWKLDLGLIAQP